MPALLRNDPPGASINTRCCIVGGGPAGMMLGYLLGRAGIDVVVLEKHADFFRDFRGDTVHPSTLQVMDELGLIDGFLEASASAAAEDGRHVRRRRRSGSPTSAGLKVKYPFIAFMPQWDFLNFLRESGKRFPSLKVMMNTDATDLIWSRRYASPASRRPRRKAGRHPRRSDDRLRRPAFDRARARRP